MIWWRILTILFGALPATILAMFAVFLISYSLVHFCIGLMTVDIDWVAGGILGVAWGGLGVYGTISLWAVGSGFVSNASINGLKAGAIAILPLVHTGFFDFPGYHPWVEKLPLLSPLAIACTWLLIPKKFREYMTDDLTDISDSIWPDAASRAGE